MAIDYIQRLEVFATELVPKMMGALIVFIVGLWAVSWLTKIIRKAMMARGFDESLQSFLASMIGVTLKVMLLVTVAGMLGIQTTSFVAILGAAGLAVGLALQGSLSNFAGGVLTLIFKPYKVGDVIETLGQNGEVKEIQIFNTILLTGDNKTVILPNGAVSNGTIINYSRHGNLRVSLHLVVDGKTSIETLRRVIHEVYAKNQYILNEPATSVRVEKISDGDLGVVVHAFCEPHLHWDAYTSLHEELKVALDTAGIQFPSPALKLVK
jgi:small conductance mechanosensitive channel